MKPLNKLKLLLLHLANHVFMFNTLLFLLKRAVLQVLSSLSGLLGNLMLAALLSVSLLALDHVVDHIVLIVFLFFLNSYEVLLVLLFHLQVLYLLLDLLLMVALGVVDVVLQLFLLALVLLLLVELLLLLLSHTFFSLRGHLLVALAKGDDLSGSFFGLLDLLPCLALFLLEQLDAVGQELRVFLGALTGHLGRLKFMVKRFLVVVLIDVEVNVLELVVGVLLMVFVFMLARRSFLVMVHVLVFAVGLVVWILHFCT